MTLKANEAYYAIATGDVEALNTPLGSLGSFH